MEEPAPKAQAVSAEADLVDEDAAAAAAAAVVPPPPATNEEPSTTTKVPLTLSVPDADGAPAGTPTPTLHASSTPAAA